MEKLKLSDGFSDRVMQKIAYKEGTRKTRRRIIIAAGSVLGVSCMVVGVAIYQQYAGTTFPLPEWLQNISNIVTVSIPAWLQALFSTATPLKPEWIHEISCIFNYLGNTISGFFSSIGSVFANIDRNILFYPAVVLILAAIGYLLDRHDRHKSSRHRSSVI